MSRFHKLSNTNHYAFLPNTTIPTLMILYKSSFCCRETRRRSCSSLSSSSSSILTLHQSSVREPARTEANSSPFCTRDSCAFHSPLKSVRVKNTEFFKLLVLPQIVGKMPVLMKLIVDRIRLISIDRRAQVCYSGCQTSHRNHKC